MGHNGQMPSIRRTQARYPVFRTVRVERILCRDLIVVIYISYWRQIIIINFLQNVPVRKKCSAFSMCHPNSQYGVFHTPEHH